LGYRALTLHRAGALAEGHPEEAEAVDLAIRLLQLAVYAAGASFLRRRLEVGSASAVFYHLRTEKVSYHLTGEWAFFHLKVFCRPKEEEAVCPLRGAEDVCRLITEAVVSRLAREVVVFLFLRLVEVCLVAY
jgi:hypothetical protein